MKNTYRVTIERIETTVLEIEAENHEEAEIVAWQRWGANSYGIAETNITNIEQLED